MKAFLESVAIHVARQMEERGEDICILLPNRRSGLFLQHHLKSHVKQSSWMPRILSITDMLDQWGSLSGLDDARAVIRLYDHYSELKKEAETLDAFYHWGEMMLRDFDELDKYLVDPDLLFRNLSDLKAIEEPLAGLEEEDLGFIRQFWEGFSEGSDSPEKQSFLEIWELLPGIYHRFTAALREERRGYQGMRYRELAEGMRDGKLSPPPGHMIVAGFNALNACEKQIFDQLREHGSDFFWDYQTSYVEHERDVAGRFIRENLERYPPQSLPGDQSNKESSCQTRIFELPSDVMQARTLHSLMADRMWTGKEECTDTAVVLCDEDLLLPVLLSIPSTGNPVNITMGYPLRGTALSSFVDQLIRMQGRIRSSGDGKLSFFHRDVEALLLHPYMAGLEKESTVILNEIRRSNRVMVEEGLLNKGLMRVLFRPVEGSLQWMDYLRKVLEKVLESFGEREESASTNRIQGEFILNLLTQLNRLEGILEERPALEGGVFLRLFRKILEFQRIPFEGEPLGGIQLMGILETRLLDFKHVIMLSMNEDIMPATPRSNSYIPYALRLAFSMPSREDMDAIYAYYFRRLLHRAETVDLLFNSKTEGVRSGEMSRYLHQLVLEKGCEIIRPSMNVAAREVHPLVMEHTPLTLEKLERYREDSEEGRFLSPSAINTFIDCPLKFYLRYLSGIGEPDEVEEEISAAGFGTVVHESIQRLYGELTATGKGILEKQALGELLRSSRVEEVLRETFLEKHFHGRKSARIEGRNVIIMRVMLAYLRKIISTDLQIAPLELVSTEATYQRVYRPEGWSGKGIRLGGLIDRVDRVDGRIRIIDYKTGSAETSFSEIENLFEPDQNSRNGAALQTLLYCWLAEESHPGEEMTPGLYVMKALYGKEFDPRFRMGPSRGKHKLEGFSQVRDEFMDLLELSLKKLFDPKLHFEQTTRESRCRYCDFAVLCSRGSFE